MLQEFKVCLTILRHYVVKGLRRINRCTKKRNIERKAVGPPQLYFHPTANIETFNRFQKQFCLHGDFTATTSQTILKLYCTCVNDNLLILMILCNFNSLQAFTVPKENSLRCEYLLRSNWENWNLHRSEFPLAWNHVNPDHEITLHQSEILLRSESQTCLSSLRVSCKRSLTHLRIK